MHVIRVGDFTDPQFSCVTGERVYFINKTRLYLKKYRLKYIKKFVYEDIKL